MGRKGAVDHTFGDAALCGGLLAGRAGGLTVGNQLFCQCHGARLGPSLPHRGRGPGDDQYKLPAWGCVVVLCQCLCKGGLLYLFMQLGQHAADRHAALAIAVQQVCKGGGQLVRCLVKHQRALLAASLLQALFALAAVHR
ncbi:hypothetical protein SDC9_175505 [bioreactor metagenome]|uniref:Uncharacterized protein n=1 Tax=bioreactor metagenome TaxID=1076179 RepID=A0A645GPF7_9ZZZZ